MCASARNVIIPTPTPPQSHDLRSTDHVCKFKERYHPSPPHPPNNISRKESNYYLEIYPKIFEFFLQEISVPFDFVSGMFQKSRFSGSYL